jgi:uncharacterized protein YkwD
MSRRPREARGPARRAALAVVPAVLVISALLVIAHDGGGPSAGTARIRAALGTPPSPLAVDHPLVTTTSSPATSAGDPAETPTTLAAAGAGAGGGGDLASLLTTTTGLSRSTAAGGTSAGATTAPAADPTTTAASASSSPSSPSSASSTSSTTSTTSTSTTTTAPPPPPVASGRLPSVEADMLPLTNNDRTGQGLGTLARNACLDGVAAGYARQMAGNGVLAHNPGAGAAVIGCRPGASWGDNVGTTGPCSAAVLEDAFMASPPHRHNILTPGFTQVGFGVWTDENGSCWMQVLFSS